MKFMDLHQFLVCIANVNSAVNGRQRQREIEKRDLDSGRHGKEASVTKDYS